MHRDRWNDHNPDYSPTIIIRKSNRTKFRRSRGKFMVLERRWTAEEREIVGLSIFRLFVIVAGMAGFIDFISPRKMAAIFTFYNLAKFIRSVELAATGTHRIFHRLYPIILRFAAFCFPSPLYAVVPRLFPGIDVCLTSFSSVTSFCVSSICFPIFHSTELTGFRSIYRGRIKLEGRALYLCKFQYFLVKY